MNEFKQLLDQTNSKRIKVYFNLTELMNITGLSIRALKYRMLTVKEKYNGIPSLLTKVDRTWRIHYSIVNEFEPKYNLKYKTEYTYNWISMATWNPKFQYDEKYHVEVVAQIKKQLPNNKISYSIELDARGVNHTHIITDVATKELNKIVTSIIRNYIEDPSECRVQVETIYNKYCLVEYIKKAPVSNGVL